jgi:nucleolar protein 4
MLQALILYLPVILPNSPAAEKLTPAEVERRTASFNARRALLKSNPSLFISKSRLSVRHIPLFVTERLLKRLAIHAVRAFEDEVKEGERPGLTADELSVVVEQPGEEDQEEGQEGTKHKKRKNMGQKFRVKQAKIVRQQERVDPVTGKGKSKGYGFIEMNTHGDALRVLRWANNNSDVGPLSEEWWKEELGDLIKLEKGKEARDEARLKRLNDELEKVTSTGAKKSKGSLIVEFSIENVQVVKRRKTLQQHALVCLSNILSSLTHVLQPDAKPPKSKPPMEIKTEERPPKKQCIPEDKSISMKVEIAKPGSKIGSLIGRKRKMRKAGNKGR